MSVFIILRTSFLKADKRKKVFVFADDVASYAFIKQWPPAHTGAVCSQVQGGKEKDAQSLFKWFLISTNVKMLSQDTDDIDFVLFSNSTA